MHKEDSGLHSWLYTQGLFVVEVVVRQYIHPLIALRGVLAGSSEAAHSGGDGEEGDRRSYVSTEWRGFHSQQP